MTLKQALWEIVRDENIIITNQNIDWLLDRASKKATGDAQALKESILERKQVIEENIPSTLTNEEKVSEKLLINENKSNNFDVKSNNEIEEMARDICKLGISCEECTMLARKTNQTRKQYCKAFEYAKRAYNAGYRKQSEGEWIHDINNLYGCSNCLGRETMSPKKLKPYCPNCGSKMKGGEE